jgi:tetratricopeptide (TPR) repeat protein
MLNAQLIEAEARRAKNTLLPDAMDLFFQGRHSFNREFTSASLLQARRFFERALAIDPENIDAMIWLGVVDVALPSSLLIDDQPQYLAAAEKILLKALAGAPDHPWGHLALGVVLVHTNRVAQGLAECERALALDHNLADAHAMMGVAKYAMGCGVETEAHVNEALRLSPRDILAFRWLALVGFSKLQFAADAEAFSWFRRGIQANRNYHLAHFGLAAALALLGKLDDARAAAKAGQALDPTFSIRRCESLWTSDSAEVLAGAKRIRKAMRLAGVTEG